jgi:uncharacterized integral membrane protein
MSASDPNVSHPASGGPAPDQAAGSPAAPGSVPATREAEPTHAPHRTRVSATWVGISIAVLVLILLIVFIAQNGRSVKISFLWLDGSFPLGLGLLVAAVAGALIVIVTGSARIVQLRQAVRGRRKRRRR